MPMLTTILSQRDVGHAAHPGSYDHDRRGQAAEDVSEAGNEADDAVQPEADRSAGNAKPVIEYDAPESRGFRPRKGRLPARFLKARGRRVACGEAESRVGCCWA